MLLPQLITPQGYWWCGTSTGESALACHTKYVLKYRAHFSLFCDPILSRNTQQYLSQKQRETRRRNSASSLYVLRLRLSYVVHTTATPNEL